jgi:8-oxo-dGTP diphosphatase
MIFAAGRVPGIVRARRPRRNVSAVTIESGYGSDETAQDVVGLPAIPVSAGALIFDQVGRLLILKPTYKSGWTIPGGVMEADGETPWDACRREVAEECGLHIGAGRPARLACMDFRSPRPGKPGGIRYLFDCGAFDDASLAGIALQPEEIAEHQVVDLRTALKMLRKPIRLRVRAATRRRALCYLENGRPRYRDR